ncbi:MAG: LemA family protein [Oligoflexia bacterium]|nr:LemA family protein [Oligoflexia bacterium]
MHQYRRIRIAIVISTIVLSIIILGGFFYYNKFVFQISNILASASNIETVLERKRNIIVNLSKMVTDYSKYEERVLSEVVNSRQVFATGKTPTQTSSMNQMNDTLKDIKKYSTNEILSKLFALSEQYPDVKVHQNLLKFIDALVISEKDLSNARTEYNDFVNVYRSSKMMFPGNFYNFFFRFKLYPFFETSDDVKNFWKINYQSDKIK